MSAENYPLELAKQFPWSTEAKGLIEVGPERTGDGR